MKCTKAAMIHELTRSITKYDAGECVECYNAVPLTSAEMRNYLSHWSSQVAPPAKLFRKAILFAVLVIIGSSGLTVFGQSGRKLPKASTPPEVKPEITPEEKPTVKREDEKARVNIILGIDGRQHSYDIPLYYYDSVLQSCADKMRDAPSVKVDVSGREMNRGEAVKLAKSQKVAFVALLQLRSEGMGPMSSDRYPDVSIEYVVFSPETAKVVTSGTTYPHAFGKGGVVVGPKTTGRTSQVYAEQMLKQAAREAADRILSALHLVLPERTIPRAA